MVLGVSLMNVVFSFFIYRKHSEVQEENLLQYVQAVYSSLFKMVSYFLYLLPLVKA